jgi:hypothetical protein
MNNLTPLLIKRPPKRCSACGEPFPVRHGGSEALVGFDGRLYCYALNAACAAQAIEIASRPA